MRLIFFISTTLLWPFMLFTQSLNNHIDSISFAIGKDVGENLVKTGVELDIDKIYEGLKEAMTQSELGTLSESEMTRLMTSFRNEAQAILNQENKNKAMEEKQKGSAFLAENAKNDDVVVLPSGLQYKVLTPGDGESPTVSSSVTVHYEGKLINGNVFDSSYKRGAPATFGVNQVISGWTEALQIMKPGAKWQLFIPSDLAYGDRGAGRDIPPGSTLIFDVELISVN